jgi:hypothetical protein
MKYNVASAYKYMAHIVANDLPKSLETTISTPEAHQLPAIPTAHSPRVRDWGTESFYVDGAYSISTGTSTMTCKGLQAVKNGRQRCAGASVGQEAAKSFVYAQAGRPFQSGTLYDALLRRLTELGYCAGNADARPVCSTHARLLSVCIAW